MSKYVREAVGPAVDQLSNWLYLVCDAGPELEKAVEKLEEVKKLAIKAIKDDDTATR